MVKSTRQSFDDKKCALTSISGAKFYWKPCQQNVEGYFSFNSKPLVGGSRVRFFHYGGQEDGGTRPYVKKRPHKPLSESYPSNVYSFSIIVLAPPPPLLLMKSKV